MGFDREGLFFISCPVSQIIFKTRAKSSTDRDELLLSTPSYQDCEEQQALSTTGKEVSNLLCSKLWISLGQD